MENDVKVNSAATCIKHGNGSFCLQQHNNLWQLKSASNSNPANTTLHTSHVCNAAITNHINYTWPGNAICGNKL